MSPASWDSRCQPIPPLGRLLWTAGPPLVRGAGRIAFSLQCERQAPAPDPPFVVAANHYSHIDPPAIGAMIGTPIRFLAVEELTAASRFLAHALPAFGAITVTRRRFSITAVRTALALLDAGEVVGLFPEGSRVARWGDSPPKRGAAWLACQAGVPLVPLAVIGTGRVLGLDNRLHRAPIKVVIGQAMSPEGENPYTLTSRWEQWVGTQISRQPHTEAGAHP